MSYSVTTGSSSETSCLLDYTLPFTDVRCGNGAYFKSDLKSWLKNQNQPPTHIIKPLTCACVHPFPGNDPALGGWGGGGWSALNDGLAGIPRNTGQNSQCTRQDSNRTTIE
jgi:hypothetical protein